MRIGQSPLARAAETAQLINERLARSAVLESDVDLREAEFSRYLQGLPYWQAPLPRPLRVLDKAKRGLVPGPQSVARFGGRVPPGACPPARRPPPRPPATP